MESFTGLYDHKWTVVAPVPWFPRIPFNLNARYDALARVPTLENERGYLVHHPRYLVIPGLFMNRHGMAMAACAMELIRQIHSNNSIDVIDAHYVFPDGAAAIQIGEALGIPVILSARGTDLNLFPSLPKIRPIIKNTLARSRKLICVSRSLKEKAISLGLNSEKIQVIGNGIDAALFRPGDRQQARAELGLPQDLPIILSVGNLIELKGHHLNIEALANLSNRDAILVIAGQGPLRNELESLVTRFELKERVIFLGGVANSDLPKWYQAADLFTLSSSREGWPNVVTEAQACGTPVVATRVAGIPEIVTSEKLGLLMDERTVDSIKQSWERALAMNWDRQLIAKSGQSRTWSAVSAELQILFNSEIQ